MKRIALALALLAAGVLPSTALAANTCDVAFFHGFTGDAYASIDGVTNADGVTGYYREGDILTLRPGTYRFEWDDLTLEDVVVSCADPSHGVPTVTGGLVPPETDTVAPTAPVRSFPFAGILLALLIGAGWVSLVRGRRP